MIKFFNPNDTEKRINEHVLHNGKVIATFIKGELETSDPEVIEALKEKGYLSDEPEQQEELPVETEVKENSGKKQKPAKENKSK